MWEIRILDLLILYAALTVLLLSCYLLQGFKELPQSWLAAHICRNADHSCRYPSHQYLTNHLGVNSFKNLLAHADQREGWLLLVAIGVEIQAETLNQSVWKVLKAPP